MITDSLSSVCQVQTNLCSQQALDPRHVECEGSLGQRWGGCRLEPPGVLFVIFDDILIPLRVRDGTGPLLLSCSVTDKKQHQHSRNLQEPWHSNSVEAVSSTMTNT